MEKNTDKQVAIVTGGASGIGLAIAEKFATNNIFTLVIGRDENKLTAAQQMLGNNGKTIQYDLTQLKGIPALVKDIQQQYGHIDILVNNAAILYDTWQSAVNADLDVVNQALTTNLYGPWKLSQVCIPLMKRNKYGRIVNVSSGAGSLHYMTSGSPAYSVSKAALNAFSRVLAADLHGTGILVNSVDPGWVATDMGGRGGRPIEEGAKGIVWAATLPDNGPSGGFFFDGKPSPW